MNALQPKFRSWLVTDVVGTARCAVTARVQRAERIVGDTGVGSDSFRRLTLRSATGTAQRAIPTNLGIRVQGNDSGTIQYDNIE